MATVQLAISDASRVTAFSLQARPQNAHSWLQLAQAARVSGPRPVQDHVPLTLGGTNAQLLRWAGAHADTVGMSGFGRTLADGHTHEVRWREHELEAQLQQVADGAVGRDSPPLLEALVQQVTLTDDAGAAVADHARETGLTEAELLSAPFMLVGTQGEIIAAIAERERRWGITRYIVRKPAFDVAAALMRRLA